MFYIYSVGFRYFTVCILLAFVVLQSCGKDSACLKSTGSTAVEIRDLQSFTHLELHDKINVELKPSSVNRITITAGENLLPYILTSVNGNKLVIQNDNSCSFLRSYKKSINVVLEYTGLKYIFSDAAGKVSSVDTIRQNYIEVDCKGSSGDFDLNLATDSARFILHTGNTNLYLNGHSGTTFLYSGGTCKINASNLLSQSCLVNNSGTGDFYISVATYLYAEINGEGNIYYRGHPTGIDKIRNGKGDLIRQ